MKVIEYVAFVHIHGGGDEALRTGVRGFVRPGLSTACVLYGVQLLL
ncbi:hypothetical protein [Anaerobiospirillum sp. NML120511]|nr:hypothetical protein [Anaerobiospirillum sp. NML120511]MCK0536024.1 hypothetical protein [Anaerobiospirillum sp. NML120511]